MTNNDERALQMSWRRARGITPLTSSEGIIVVLAAVPIVAYAAVVVRTIGYPYPLEWMEGGTIDVARRVLDGLPVYTRPSLDYVPYRYTPLYYMVTAAVARLVGLDLFAGRLVSFVSICGAACFIWAFVRKEGAGAVSAWASVGLFFAMYYKVLRWFHLARNDSFLLLLLLAAFYALRFGDRFRSVVVAGVLLWLAFLAKQTALIVAGVALPLAAFGAPRRSLSTAAIITLLVLATNAVMDARSGGWWGFFVYRLPISHPLDHDMWLGFWRHDILRWMPLAGLAALALVWRTAATDRSTAAFYGGLVAGTLAAGWGARVDLASANVLMPAYAALAITMPLGLRAALGRGHRHRVLMVTAAQLLIPLQASIAVLHDPWPFARLDPAPADRFVSFLKGVDGAVLNWDLRFVVTRAGKRSHGLEAAAEDLEGAIVGPGVALARELENEIVAACLEGRFAGVVDAPAWLQAAVPFEAPLTFPGVEIAPGEPTRDHPLKRRGNPER